MSHGHRYNQAGGRCKCGAARPAGRAPLPGPPLFGSLLAVVVSIAFLPVVLIMALLRGRRK